MHLKNTLVNNMLQLNDTFSEKITFTQEQVNLFAQVTGDHNPLHLDEAYAATTTFKKPIVHGMLSVGIISKVLGTQFPGEGTVYLKQDVEFKRPIYTGTEYIFEFTVVDIDTDKHLAKIQTIVKDTDKNKIHLSGVAQIMNNIKI
jgi:acyl dehydratase